MHRWLLALLVLGCAPTPTPTDEEADTDDLSQAPIAAYDPLDWVDPFIATGGQGAEIANVNPGATVPFGLTLVGPDTRLDFGAPGFYHCAGYWYEDTFVRHFSHTHAHGMGVPDYGAIPFLPRDGWQPGFTYEHQRMLPLDHAEESARPGSYHLRFAEEAITVDIAGTLRGGHTRMQFAEGADPVVVLDLGAAVPEADVVDAWADWAPGEAEVVGFQRVSGSYSRRFGGLMTHFSAVLDPAPIAGGGWNDRDVPTDDLRHVEGTTSGLWFTFPEGTTEVHLRVGLSYVDVDGARANREAELPDLDWDARVAEAETAWRDLIGRVRVAGGTDEQRTVFHTALFHSAIMPSRQDDVDGRYRGADQEVHTADGPHYSDLSLWDTFRTLHPWYLLAWPEVQNDVNRSIVRMIEDGGVLPKWPLAHGNTGGMVGSPAMQVLAESWLKGVRDWDAETAFDAAYATATGPVSADGRGGIGSYRSKGYVPDEEGSVSDTLEYAWNDHALALWAASMGRTEAAEIAAQAGNWRNVWSPEHRFNTARYADGSFAFRRADLWEPWFVEGNAWHYLWYAPFDTEGMIALQHDGDKDAFVARMAQFWADVEAEDDDVAPDDFYWHGNEPVMHLAFLGSLVGEPDLTSDASRLVLATRYDTSTSGLDGNDDAGTLSAWYLWAAIGLFPVAGTDQLAFSSPLFERVEIARSEGTTLVLRASGTSDQRRYLSGWTLGGEPLPTSHLTHTALLERKELVFELADVPGTWDPPTE